MKKKYELVNQQQNGLWQIKALKNFGDVKTGELGGYIEKEENLFCKSCPFYKHCFKGDN